MEEIWKDIKGYERLYQVSNTGKVKRLKGSTRTKRDRILTNKTKSNGYKFVCLSAKSSLKYLHVHRLVAVAFIPNLKNKLFVNHIDCDKSNNKVTNLEWVTAKENSSHARKNVVFNYSILVGIDNKTTKQIAQKDKQGNVLYLWDCVQSIKNHYDISESAINRACRKGTVSFGFMWEHISKGYYLEESKKFSNPPVPVITNKKDRDLSFAHTGKEIKNNAITNEDLIQIGLDCYYKYGNIHRVSLENYARDNCKKSYGFIVKRFKTFINFQILVKQKITQ